MRVPEGIWRLLSDHAQLRGMTFAAYIRDVLEREVVEHQARDALREDIRTLALLHQRLQDEVDRTSDHPGDTDPDMQARSIETLLILRSVMQPMHLGNAHQEMERAGITPWNLPLPGND